MPISITPSNPGGMVGPGLTMRLQTDLIGPLPVGTVWTVEINTPGGEAADLGFFQLTSASHFVDLTLQLLEPGWSGPTHLNEVARELADVVVNVTIQEVGGGPAQDTGSSTLPWSNTAGLPNIVDKEGGGQLTPEEQAQLSRADDQTNATFQNSAGDQTIVPVSDLVHLPNLQQLVINATTHDLVDSGSLLVPNTGGIALAYGFQLVVTAVPAGIGRFVGFVDKFSRRVAQIVIARQELVTGEFLYLRYIDLDVATLAVLFDSFPPSDIGFFVEPGCSVQLRWLQLP